MHDAEEFYIPDNVITEYRLWFLGVKQLKRLAFSPVIGLVAALLSHSLGAPLWLSILAGIIAPSTYALLYAFPLGLYDEALIDSWLELRRHQTRQNYYPSHDRHGGASHAPQSAAQVVDRTGVDSSQDRSGSAGGAGWGTGDPSPGDRQSQSGPSITG